MTAALQALAERLEKATGPDREIDAALCREFLPPNAVAHVGCAGKTNAFTASLDAAIALCTRVLPGWLVGIRETGVWAAHHKWAGKPVWNAELVDIGESDSAEPFCDPADADEDDDVVIASVDHCHPALAVCLAAVRARHGDLECAKLAEEPHE